MSRNITVSDEVGMNKIYLIRGRKEMVDRGLFELYGVKAIRLREQVSVTKRIFWKTSRSSSLKKMLECK